MAQNFKKPPSKWVRILVVKTLRYRDIKKGGYRYKTFSGELEIKADANGSIIDTNFDQLLENLLNDLPEDDGAMSSPFVNMVRLS